MTRLGGGGNAGAVESMENQTQVFHPFHRPLKIPQTRRDFHISTARGLRRLEKWKTQTRFPTFPPGARDDDDGFPSQLKDQRKEVDRSAAASFSDALSLRSSGAAFMLIFQLENALKTRLSDRAYSLMAVTECDTPFRTRVRFCLLKFSTVCKGISAARRNHCENLASEPFSDASYE